MAGHFNYRKRVVETAGQEPVSWGGGRVTQGQFEVTTLTITIEMIIKYIFDRVMAAIGLLLLWPVLLVVAILVKVKMPGGPAFFVQNPTIPNCLKRVSSGWHWTSWGIFGNMVASNDIISRMGWTSRVSATRMTIWTTAGSSGNAPC